MKVVQIIIQRFFLLIIVLFLVSLITFAIINIIPGDVANAILGDLGTQEQVDALRERLGLNLPMFTRYWVWIGQLLQGDFGTSLQTGREIAPIMMARLGNSAILGGLTLLVAVPLAILLGVAAAVHRGRIIDRTISALTTISFSLPEYVIGLLLILVFSIWYPILPGTSLMAPDANPLARPQALVLPVVTLALGMLAYLSQFTRAGMIGALESPYVRTAILKGIPGWVVVLKHALPNVLLPTICEIGMIFGYVLGGIVIVETMFSYSGIGQMTVEAIAYRDIPVVQASVLVVAIAYSVGNLFADIISIILNPRLRT